MKTLKLTTEDADCLLFALGYAKGASHGREGSPDFSDLTDRILVQLSPTAYTYARPRAEVVAELEAQGIDVPTANG